MIVDTSALVAIIKGEEDAGVYASSLAQAVSSGERIRLSAPSYFEFGMVIDRYRDDRLSEAVEMLIAEFGIEVIACTRDHADLARIAYQTFGKGNHPARLNFGDCFAYALTRWEGEPLLFKGDDFALTDVKTAV